MLKQRIITALVLLPCSLLATHLVGLSRDDVVKVR